MSATLLAALTAQIAFRLCCHSPRMCVQVGPHHGVKLVCESNFLLQCLHVTACLLSRSGVKWSHRTDVFLPLTGMWNSRAAKLAPKVWWTPLMANFM